MKEFEENDQYLPNVGEHCEVLYDGEWTDCYICGVDTTGSLVFELMSDDFDVKIDAYHQYHQVKFFRKK